MGIEKYFPTTDRGWGHSGSLPVTNRYWLYLELDNPAGGIGGIHVLQVADHFLT